MESRKTLNSDLQIRCDYVKKEKAKYLCKKYLGKTLSEFLREQTQSVINEHRDRLSKKERTELMEYIYATIPESI